MKRNNKGQFVDSSTETSNVVRHNLFSVQEMKILGKVIKNIINKRIIK